MNVRKKIVISVNAAWNIANFRSGLIRGLQDAGYDVVAVAPTDNAVGKIEALGCRYVPLLMDNTGTHPGRDFQLLLRYIRILKQEKPAAFLGYTIKPNIYGSLAAHWVGVPVINNIAGLGATFIRDTWLTQLVKRLYRLALSRSKLVFFQNGDDQRLFVDGGIVPEITTALVPGSGIDLQRFTPLPPRIDKPFRFILIARLLWDKGVGEYIEAARAIRAASPDIECTILGFLDVKNPAAIDRAQMDAWVEEGVVRYLGESEDVRPFIEQADCVVLPSYREGTPRVLLEAAAMGRPIVTTDTVGCREVVDDGENGYLCRVKDAQDLADKMKKMAALSAEQRYEMGCKGRRKMELQFDENIVVQRYVAAVNQLARGMSQAGKSGVERIG